MTHPIHRVTRFTIVGAHRIVVAFADGSEQCIDFQPVLRGPLFGPLRDPAIFNAVALDLEAGTLTWPNDPATLHDWPAVCDELAARATSWTATGSHEPMGNPVR